jgi:hypothetical protein
MVSAFAASALGRAAAAYAKQSVCQQQTSRIGFGISAIL